MKINKTYVLITLILFSMEVLIAMYLKTSFIRHTFGDFMAVILLYCFFKSFIQENHFKIALSVLLLAFIIEFLQLINILSMFNLQNNHLIKLLLGTTFHFSDLVAYTLGILTVLLVEYKLQNHE